jgi:hypothetical protein
MRSVDMKKNETAEEMNRKASSILPFLIVGGIALLAASQLLL